jgi:radical SAM protein with 4Fe4S-binding SPASM domain
LIKINPYSYVPWPLYSYLVKTYSNYFLSGKCLDYPRVIQIQTQSRCNGRCEMCPYRITSMGIDHGVMDNALFNKILEELRSEKQQPMFMFALHNEPLLEKNIFEQISSVKSILPNCYCILPTNGQLLELFSPNDIKTSGIDQLNINLGAYTKETYERIYSGFNYEHLRNNLNRLFADDSLKKKIQIMYVLNKENTSEARMALNYWKEQGVRTKVIQFHNRAGSLDNYERLRLKYSSYIGAPILTGWKNLTNLVRRGLGCELPFYQMNILFNGDVILCSCDWKRATVVGNLKYCSIKSIWNSERFNSLRQMILRKRYNQIMSCKECSMVN